MKKILYIFILLPIITGCNFLEVTPVGKTTIPLFFSDMDGVRAAVPGIYSSIYTYYDAQFSKYSEIAGNMSRLSKLSTSGDMMSEYDFISESADETGAVGAIWTDIFYAMANVNNLLEYHDALLEAYPKNKKELMRIKAESLFARALCHFDICRVYGQSYNYTSDASHLGVPIVTRTPGADDNISRQSVKQVYQQIVNDLKLAEASFNVSDITVNTGRGRYYASKNSVSAMLSRVYLYKEQWDSVVFYSTRLINEIPLSKGSEYLDMYNNMSVSNEAIFRLNGTKKNSKLEKFYDPIDPVAIPADTLLSLFTDPTDMRLNLLRLIDENGKTVSKMYKYHITATVPAAEKHRDIFIFRVSEMYLNRAEAYLNQGELTLAAADVKAIIARALGKELAEITNVPDNDPVALAKIIEIERAKELCFEGHQFFDIVRRKQDLIRDAKTNSNVKLLTYPNDRFVLPIPLKELQANLNMQPNPNIN